MDRIFEKPEARPKSKGCKRQSGDREIEKCNALADVMPTTVEGAIALLTYVGKNETTATRFSLTPSATSHWPRIWPRSFDN